MITLCAVSLAGIGCTKEQAAEKTAEYKAKILYNADIREAIAMQLTESEKALIVETLTADEVVYSEEVPFEEKASVKAVKGIADIIPIPFVGEAVGLGIAGFSMLQGFRRKKKDQGVIGALIGSIEESGSGDAKRTAKKLADKAGVGDYLFSLVRRLT